MKKKTLKSLVKGKMKMKAIESFKTYSHTNTSKMII